MRGGEKEISGVGYGVCCENGGDRRFKTRRMETR